jgi:hypothetical protein
MPTMNVGVVPKSIDDLGTRADYLLIANAGSFFAFVMHANN